MCFSSWWWMFELHCVEWLTICVCLWTDPGPVRWLWLWQCWVGPVRQRRAEPSSQRRSVGDTIAVLSGLYAGPPYRTSVDDWTQAKTSFGEQPSQAYTKLSVQYITVVMRDHNNYTQTMTGRLVGFVVCYIRWHQTFVITWHQIFWQLVTSDKCHLISVGVFSFFLLFLGKVVTEVTEANVPVQQKPFHRRTRTHKIPRDTTFVIF